MIRSLSKDGLNRIRGNENCKLISYQDKGGVWTIGYGHTRGVGPNQTCTPAQAEQWLMEDSRTAIAAVNVLVVLELNQDEFDALVDLVFNIGVTAFKSSTMLKLLNKSKLKEASLEFKRWDHVKGVEVAGLLDRRIEEEHLFEKGLG